MCLNCKVGVYNRVINEILDLKVPKKNIFQLFGPIDILVQFNEIKGLDEFVKKWFDPIRMIGTDENLITETLTFIVIKEGPSIAEKPFAFLFLNTKPQNLDKVRVALLDVPEVLSADTVFGPYDVICPINVKDKAELERSVAYISVNIPGIEKTMTAIVATDYFSHLTFG